MQVGPAEPLLLGGSRGHWGESRGRLEPTWRGQQEKGLNCGFVGGGAAGRRGLWETEKGWQSAASG